MYLYRDFIHDDKEFRNEKVGIMKYSFIQINQSGSFETNRLLPMELSVRKQKLAIMLPKTRGMNPMEFGGRGLEIKSKIGKCRYNLDTNMFRITNLVFQV